MNLSENGMPFCFQCGHELSWDSSEPLGDRNGNEDDFGTIDFYHCLYCGKDYKVCDLPVEEYNNYPFYDNIQQR